MRDPLGMGHGGHWILAEDFTSELKQLSFGMFLGKCYPLVNVQKTMENHCF